MKPISLNAGSKRLLVQLMAAVAILALFILAAGLPHLTFEPAQSFEFPREQRVIKTGDSSLDLTWLLLIVLGLSALLVLFSLIVVLISPDLRKSLLKRLRVLMVMLTFYALLLMSTSTQEEIEEEPIESKPEILDQTITSESSDAETVPVEPFTSPDLPPWQGYLAGVAAILLVGGIGYAVWLKIRPEEDELGDIARMALRDLSLGRHWEDTVIQCYARMSAAVSQQRGIYRHNAMTPSEFAAKLQEAGLPTEPVQNLTHLFEKARYGYSSSGDQEANEAFECLSNILQVIENHV